MEIKCSKCGFTSHGPDSLVGKKLKCPKCGKEFVEGSGCEFTVVEDKPTFTVAVEQAPGATEKAKAVKENFIGYIGTLEVTSKRVRGMIYRKSFGRTGRRKYVDVLLNLVNGITVQVINKTKARWFQYIMSLLSGLVSAVLFCHSGHPEFCPISVLIVILGWYFDRAVYKDRVLLLLSISGEDYFIPFQASQLFEAECKCTMLKKAKSEYECIEETPTARKKAPLPLRLKLRKVRP